MAVSFRIFVIFCKSRCRVAIVRTDVSEERIVPIIRVEIMSALGKLAVAINCLQDCDEFFTRVQSSNILS
jgi:hypothetical protein